MVFLADDHQAHRGHCRMDLDKGLAQPADILMGVDIAKIEDKGISQIETLKRLGPGQERVSRLIGHADFGRVGLISLHQLVERYQANPAKVSMTYEAADPLLARPEPLKRFNLTD